MKEHPTRAELLDLLGRGGQDDDQALLEHVSGCDECFEVYDGLWAQALEARPELAEALLESATSRRLEARLFRRIHLASLGTASSWLVTQGFLCVLLGVLLPIVDLERAPAAGAGGERP